MKQGRKARQQQGSLLLHFNDETPPHDALSVERLVDQILVLGEDFCLLTWEDVPTLLATLRSCLSVAVHPV